MNRKDNNSGSSVNNLAKRVTLLVFSAVIVGTCAASAAKIVRDNAEYGTTDIITETITEEVTLEYTEPADTTASVTVPLTAAETETEVQTSSEPTTKPVTTAKKATTTVRTTKPKTTSSSEATVKSKVTTAVKTTAEPKTTVKLKTTVKPKTTAKPVPKDATVKITVVDSNANPIKSFTVKVPAGTRMNTIYLRDVIKDHGYTSTGEFSGDAFFAMAEDGKSYSLTAYVS